MGPASPGPSPLRRLPVLNMKTATRKRSTTKTKTRRDYEADLVNGLIELMEAGTNPWARDWRGSQTGQHRNMITGHHYSGGNPALLELQMMLRGADLPLWVPIGMAKAKGWYPRKGSKGCCIIRPFFFETDAKDQYGKPITDENGDPTKIQGTGFSYTGGIFNVADLQGEGLEAAIAEALGNGGELRTEPERHDAAEAVLGNWGVPVRWMGNRAFYSPTADAITLPPRDAFQSSAGLYATWAHEAIHSTGHESRLKRDGIVNFGGFGSDSYAKEELIAELGAFLLCSRLEISSRADNHASYLSHWIKCLKQQPAFLKTAISAATKAANAIAPQEHTEASGE